MNRASFSEMYVTIQWNKYKYIETRDEMKYEYVRKIGILQSVKFWN